MAGTPLKFVNGEEGQQVLAGLGRVNLRDFPAQSYAKSWVGALYGVYKYEGDKINPVLMDKLKLVDMQVNRQGASGILVSLVNGGVSIVSSVPATLAHYPIVLSFPQRTYFEKTIQRRQGEEDYIFGLSACIQTHHKKRLGCISEDVPFFDSWNVIRDLFTDGEAFSREVETLKARVNLL